MLQMLMKRDEELMMMLCPNDDEEGMMLMAHGQKTGHTYDAQMKQRSSTRSKRYIYQEARA